MEIFLLTFHATPGKPNVICHVEEIIIIFQQLIAYSHVLLHAVFSG